ncbi:unnamed protein product [Symbiodinium natans]|uniref:Uncharacterized protein n=1 Tax=Symbiodinium natans TaxID=878477 RepID=A0A812JAB5_9DINO|nr:unnamed protein product [Symbiodinium natans]
MSLPPARQTPLTSTGTTPTAVKAFVRMLLAALAHPAPQLITAKWWSASTIAACMQKCSLANLMKQFTVRTQAEADSWDFSLPSVSTHLPSPIDVSKDLP